jgi:hypothetical protein
MLVLHGIYDHGKVEINEKALLELSGKIKRKIDGIKIQKKIRSEWAK